MKLSLDALKQRAEATASEELLATISGGTENACHPVDIRTQGQLELGAQVQKFINWLFQ